MGTIRAWLAERRERKANLAEWQVWLDADNERAWRRMEEYGNPEPPT